MLNVLAIDNDLLTLEALASRLATKVNFDLAQSVEEMRLKLTERTYDAMILDIELGSVKGTALLPELKKTGIPVLILSADSSPETINLCIKLGASGYLVKGDKSLDIVSAIHQVAEGRMVFPINVVVAFDRQPLEAILQRLVPREREALDLMLHGYSYKEIGRHMGIEEGTARNYGGGVVFKFGAKNRSKLPHKAQSLGYFAPDTLPPTGKRDTPKKEEK